MSVFATITFLMAYLISLSDMPLALAPTLLKHPAELLPYFFT